MLRSLAASRTLPDEINLRQTNWCEAVLVCKSISVFLYNKNTLWLYYSCIMVVWLYNYFFVPNHNSFKCIAPELCIIGLINLIRLHCPRERERERERER